VTQTNEPAPVVPETAPIPPSAGGAAAVPATVPATVPGAQPGHLGAPPIGKIRSTGTCVLLSIVTLGVYTWYWYYKTHEEMKAHSGTGIGGPLALILAMFVGIAMPFLTPSEVGGLYERRGQAKPVSGSTGLWFLLLGWLLFVGAIVWFVKTNGALNAYWRSVGAQG
jgi:hypothetical protein